MDTAPPQEVVPPPGSGCVHDALFSSSTDELVATTIPFVRGAWPPGTPSPSPPPPPTSSARPTATTSPAGGMGVWPARQLCDHVDVSSGPGGVTMRLTTALR